MKYVSKKRAHGSNGISGPRYPGIAQSALWLTSPLKFLDKCQSKYGDVFKLNLLGWSEHLIVADPNFVKEIMKSQGITMQAGKGNMILKNMLGEESVLIADGNDHTSKRRALIETVSRKRVSAAIQAAEPSINDLISTHIKKYGRKLNLVSLTREMSLTYVITLIAGPQKVEEIQKLTRLFDRVLGVSGTIDAIYGFNKINRLPLLPERFGKRKFQDIDDALLNLIEKSSNIDADNHSAIQSLRGSLLSKKSLLNQVMSLIIAGADTTATACLWGFLWMANKETTLHQYREAIEANDKDFENSFYLESLRIVPVFEIVSRGLRSSYSYKGMQVSQNTLVSPCIYLIHRNPKIYADPLEFIPDRFIGWKPKPWEFFPYGLGGRKCIGALFAEQQFKSIFKKLLVESHGRIQASEDINPARKHLTIFPKGSMSITL